MYINWKLTSFLSFEFPKNKNGGGGGIYMSQVPEILIIETTLYLISPQ